MALLPRCPGLLFALLAACSSGPTIGGRLISGARVDPAPARPREPGAPLAALACELANGHLLVPGKGAVLQLYRRRSNREIAQEALEIVTIELPAGPRRSKLSLPGGVESFAYSYSVHGRQVIASGRAVSASGALRIRRRGKGLLIDLDARLAPGGSERPARNLNWSLQIPTTARLCFDDLEPSAWREGFWFLERVR